MGTPERKTERSYNYVNGDFDGKQQDFYKSGALKVQVTYQNNQKEGPYEEWNSSGKPLLYVYYEKRDMIDGPFQSWYPNGNKKSDVTYVHGKIEGAKNEWFENGQQVAFTKFYAWSWREGTERMGSTGALLFEANFEHDQPKGSVQEWYPSKQIKRLAYYEGGKLQGDEVHEMDSPSVWLMIKMDICMEIS